MEPLQVVVKPTSPYGRMCTGIKYAYTIVFCGWPIPKISGVYVLRDDNLDYVFIDSSDFDIIHNTITTDGTRVKTTNQNP